MCGRGRWTHLPTGCSAATLRRCSSSTKRRRMGGWRWSHGRRAFPTRASLYAKNWQTPTSGCAGTPTVEIDLCGHATLASAHCILEDGRSERARRLRRDRHRGGRSRPGTRLRLTPLCPEGRYSGGSGHRRRTHRAGAILGRPARTDIARRPANVSKIRTGRCRAERRPGYRHRTCQSPSSTARSDRARTRAEHTRLGLPCRGPGRAGFGLEHDGCERPGRWLGHGQRNALFSRSKKPSSRR